MYKVMLTNTSGLTTYNPVTHSVDLTTSPDCSVAIPPRRCNVNLAEVERILAEAKALNAKIAAEAAAIRNS